jgi:two-component system nitrate/nitrite response regulator NarL
MRPDATAGEKPPARLLITDKTALGCQLLSKSFENRSDLVHSIARATSSEEVVWAANASHPDVALISAALSDGPLAGFKTLPILQSVYPRCSNVVLLDDHDHDLVVDAFRAHARGVFFRAEPIEHLIKCVSAVHQGQIWARAEDLRAVLDAFSECAPFYSPNNADLNLTKREFEISTLVAAAQTNRQISRRLNLSEHTVKNYLFRIFEKVGVGSRIELAVYIMNLQQNTHLAQVSDREP